MNLAIRKIDSSQVKWNPEGSFERSSSENNIKDLETVIKQIIFIMINRIINKKGRYI
jgi:hypothetical protein